MGERIKDMSKMKLGNGDLVIELNESQNDIDGFDIHIEAPMFRYSLSDCDFMGFASAVLEARKKLLHTKQIKENCNV